MIRFDGLPPEVVQAMCTPMHQILSIAPSSGGGALYLGSLSAFLDKDLLRTNRISHLVQALDEPCIFTEDDFECYCIKIKDIASAPLGLHLDGACKDIDQALRSGKNVLVHCQQGISRSPAIVIGYLIRHRDMTYDTAHALVKHKRPCIKPNDGFVACLRDWEKQERPERPVIARRQTTH